MSNFQSEQKKNLANSLRWQIKSIESILNDKYADRLSIPLLYATIGKADMLCAILSADHEEEAGKEYLQELKQKAEQFAGKFLQEADNNA